MEKDNKRLVSYRISDARFGLWRVLRDRLEASSHPLSKPNGIFGRAARLDTSERGLLLELGDALFARLFLVGEGLEHEFQSRVESVGHRKPARC